MTRDPRSLLLLSLLSAAGCGAPAAPPMVHPLCQGVTGTCAPVPAGSDEKAVQTAFALATAGTTIVFDTGTYTFTNGLNCSPSSSSLTVRGQGSDKTVLDFSAQKAGSQAIYCNRDDFLIERLAVVNSAGDAVKTERATGVTMRHLKVVWDRGEPATHGAYGLYPVQCKNVLIEDSTVMGASDSGIYVGQSEQIIVRRNSVSKNVGGIEIENCHGADVLDNTATGNTAGILVFALPTLEVQETRQIRIVHNDVSDNNHVNFARVGNLLEKVPSGAGLVIMASAHVEVTKNTFARNGTAHVGVISYFLTMLPAEPAYYPYSSDIYIHDNTYIGGGDHPDPNNLLGQTLGALPFPSMIVSNVLWDGFVDPGRTPTTTTNPMQICVKEASTVTFANLRADMNFNGFSLDVTPYQCTMAALPAVSLPGGK